MAAVPPDRMIFVDPVPDARELFVAELRAVVSLPVSGCSPEEVERDPARMAGALGVCLPYHLEALRSLAPGGHFEVVHLELPEAERQAILALPAGAVVLVVSHASTVLPFATVLGRTLRGDEILVETRLLSDRRGWQRLLPAVDLVLADVLALPVVSRARPKRIHEMRLLSTDVVERLREALEFVVPAPPEE
jgi:GntR family transcriptional regulator